MSLETDQLEKDEAGDINILIIGETGIGKSTWVNAIATYLSFDTLKQAAKSPLPCLIPTDFTYTTTAKDGEIQVNEVKIRSTAAGDNENMKAGESHTLKPKAHLFAYKDHVVRIIDTPGISDTRGIIQDKKNMQEIVDYISELSHLNLIVFLLPPDQSRLTVGFIFCFKELIMQFHRSAAENIVFAFTKSASSGFKVGETFTPLSLLLNEIKEQQGIALPLNKNTTYAFDNVSYRHLCIAAIKGKSPYNKQEMKTIERSFDISSKELIRLIKHAIEVKTHNPQFTAMLNYTRNIILRLAGPMAMISSSVQQTLQKIKERETDLEKYKGEELELHKNLFRPVTVVRYRVERRRSVFCGNCAVLKIYRGDARLPYIEADPECADEDPLEMYETESLTPDEDGEYYCDECEEDFEQQVSYKTYCRFKEDKLEKNETVHNRLTGVQKNRKDVVDEIAKSRKFRDEILKERETIIKASAKFAAYLKSSSIVPYNDVTERYLDTLIDVEQKKNGGNSDFYKNLIEMKKEYQQEKKIIDENLEKAVNDGVITPEEVNILVRTLIELQHYGEDIVSALTVAKGEDDSDDEEDGGGNGTPNVFVPRPKPPKYWRKLIGKLGELKLLNF